MARRPGQLTEKDKLKLQSQGVLPDCPDELAIATARWNLDKECKIVEVKSGKSLSREKVLESIGYLLLTTQNDGGKEIFNHYCICSNGSPLQMNTSPVYKPGGIPGNKKWVSNKYQMPTVGVAVLHTLI